MICGLVDLGSNTIRLSIYQCENGQGRLLMHRKVMAGLADYVEAGALTAAAFSQVLGPAGQGVVALSLLLFAFSSILGWSYYGQQCLRFLAGSDRFLLPYRAVFLLCVLAGAVWEPAAVWLLVDLCNALMALPNLTALLLLSPQALKELDPRRPR